MAQKRVTGRLEMGKGSFMTFKCDDSQPEDSVDRHWIETSYDGEPDSFVNEAPAHWHKHHDEYWQVIEGRIEILLDGKRRIITPDDGKIFVPRLTVHGFTFIKGEKAMFTEQTNPTSDFKKKFFEDVFDDGKMTFASIARAAYDGDTYFALPGGFKIVDEAFVLGFGGLMKWMFPQKNQGLATTNI